MREFRIKVNNEKTYVVKANDYNQAVKTLHSKLRDFDDTKKNINVVREFITNNGGKFSKSKDADAILDFIYKKTGVKNADYGDVLYIVRNYTNVKVEDNAVSDSISKYNGEDAIKTNGFVKIKEDGDWTSYKYNGSDFDDAVFKIHQYNPSLIAFVSNGNETITVRNKYLNDSDDMVQGEIEVLKSFGFDYKDGRWVKESDNNDIIVQPDYHYVSVIGPGDTEKHCKKYQYQSAGMLKKIIASNIKDSSINDIDGRLLPQSAKELKEELGLAKRVMGSHKSKGIREYKPRQNQLNNRDVAEINEAINDAIKYLDQGYGKDSYWRLEADLKRIQETMPADTSSEEYKVLQKVLKKGTKALEAIKSYTLKNDSSIEDSDSYQVWTINEKGVYHKEAEVSDPQSAKAIASQLKKQGRWAQISKNSKTNIVSDSDITDADPVRVEKIIRKEKSALGITYYLFQTKSNSGATIYYEVTDKTYHGEPTYSGGGVISFSLKTANDSLDSHLLSDKLKAKYGEKEGTKRYLRGENDSAINDMAETDMSMLQQAKRAPAHNIYYNRVSYDDLKRTINKVMQEGNDKDVVNILIGQLSELKKDYETDIKNSKLDKEETKRHYGEYKRLVNNYKNSHISKEYTNAVNSFLSAIKDSNNIKNRKSYTIKVGDKQYKVFAESESEAIDKYIKSKK